MSNLTELKRFAENIAHSDYDSINFSDISEWITEARKLITRIDGETNFEDPDWFPSS